MVSRLAQILSVNPKDRKCTIVFLDNGTIEENVYLFPRNAYSYIPKVGDFCTVAVEGIFYQIESAWPSEYLDPVLDIRTFREQKEGELLIHANAFVFFDNEGNLSLNSEGSFAQLNLEREGKISLQSTTFSFETVGIKPVEIPTPGNRVQFYTTPEGDGLIIAIFPPYVGIPTKALGFIRLISTKTGVEISIQGGPLGLGCELILKDDGDIEISSKTITFNTPSFKLGPIDLIAWLNEHVHPEKGMPPVKLLVPPIPKKLTPLDEKKIE